jgi:glucose-6-phosphate 1-epimerase
MPSFLFFAQSGNTMYTFMNTEYSSVSASNREQITTLDIKTQHCSAEIALFGAHLLSFIPNSDGRDRLWLSPTAVMNKSKPIRGGVPICWPWFSNIYPNHEANKKLPAHGFVRDQDWHVHAITETKDETVIMLSPNQLGMFGFSSKVSVFVEFTFAEKCSIKLITKNASMQSVRITAALHSYFNVNDIHQTEILGIEGEYLDKTRGNTIFQQSKPYLFTGETDRIHLQSDNQKFELVTVTSNNDNIAIEQRGHDSVVVWNPWQEKSETMADMQDTGYLNMLCIEAAVTQGIDLAANAEHVLMQIIS